MKQKKRKRFVLIFTRGIILLSLIVYACSEDVFSDKKINSDTSAKDGRVRSGNKELTLERAEQWYKENYMPVLSLRSLSATKDRPKLVKPDWTQAKESNKGRFEVVETPMKTRNACVTLDSETVEKLNMDEAPDFIYNKASMVFLTDTLEGYTRGFITVFVGTYEYLQKKRIRKNSYLYRDPEFDGSVYFYELDGVFINGWKYEDGKIVSTISESFEDDISQSDPSTRALVYNCYTDWVTDWVRVCDEYTNVEWDEEYGDHIAIIVECRYESYTTPYTYCEWYDDGSGSGSGGGGGPGNVGNNNNNNNNNNNDNNNQEQEQEKEPEERKDCPESAETNSNNAIDALTGGAVENFMKTLRSHAKTQNKEYGILIEKNNGTYTVADNKIIQGTSEFIEFENYTSKTVFDVHTHYQQAITGFYGHTGPSVTDLYAVLEVNSFYCSQSSSSYKGSIIIAYDGSEYLIYVDDHNKANSFFEANGYKFEPDDGGLFRNIGLRDEYTSITENLEEKGYSKIQSNDYALTYLLDKYDTGLKISKRDISTSDYKEMKTVNSNDSYTPQKCK